MPFVYKLAVLGDGGVGKSALVSRLRFQNFIEEFDPTIEDFYMIDMVVNDQQCTLEITDTAGVDEYSHLRDGWIRANEGFILVYSISSRLSFTRIQGLHDQIQQIKESTHPDTSSQVPIILIGNKADIAKRKVSRSEGEDMARKLGCTFLEASAKDGGKFEETFCTVVRQLQKYATGIEALDDLVDSLPENTARLKYRSR